MYQAYEAIRDKLLVACEIIPDYIQATGKPNEDFEKLRLELQSSVYSNAKIKEAWEEESFYINRSYNNTKKITAQRPNKKRSL